MACLGVTDADWREFAEAAVHALVLDLAAAAYTRMGDARMLNGVQRLSQRISEGLAAHLAHAAARALLVRLPEQDTAACPCGSSLNESEIFAVKAVRTLFCFSGNPGTCLHALTHVWTKLVLPHKMEAP